MIKYGILLDYSMMANTFETNQVEAFEYINPSLIIWVILTGVIPCILLLLVNVQYQNSIPKAFAKRAISMILSIAVLLLIAFFYSKDYFSVGRNNMTIRHKIIPVNFVVSSFKYVKNKYFMTKMPFKNIGTDAKDVSKITSKPSLLIIVVGETARSSNYSLNGYNKPTNSFTEQEENLISYKTVYSCGTATLVSVPCMFSNMTQPNYKQCIAQTQSNLLDILTNANISVLWKENNEGCKRVCDRIPTIYPNKENNPFCNGDTCFDESLLENLEEEIENMKNNRVVVVHLFGSHGPCYFRRYPDSHRFFTPDCRRSDIENCSDIELINTYDNTIRYTDYVLEKLITKLKKLEPKYNSCMIYMSDHGESLGEDGMYLHGLPYAFAELAHKEQIMIPMIIWSSNEFNKIKGVDNICLHKNSISETYSHDNLFHSVLGIMDVQTNEYNPALDIFATCRK